MIKLGLRIRFFLYSNTLIVVTMTLVAVLGAMYQRRTLSDAIVSRGRSIVESMAVPITYVEGQDEAGMAESGLIERYIAEVMARNQDLMRYVVVTDGTGVVTHSSRSEMVGWPFDRALAPDDIDAGPQADEQLDSNKEDVLEVRSALVDGGDFLGTLAVGFSLQPIERQVRDVAGKAGLVALVLMLGNSIMTALYVETLIRPILHLNETMKRAGEGNLTVRAPTRRGDEVAELGGSSRRRASGRSYSAPNSPTPRKWRLWGPSPPAWRMRSTIPWPVCWRASRIFATIRTTRKCATGISSSSPMVSNASSTL
jgi:methyl-accepting chemotaxis protein